MNDKNAERKRAERTSEITGLKSKYEAEKDGRCAGHSSSRCSFRHWRQHKEKTGDSRTVQCREISCYALWPGHHTVCTRSTTYYTAFIFIFIQTSCNHCSSILLCSAWAGRQCAMNECTIPNQAATPRRFKLATKCLVML